MREKLRESGIDIIGDLPWGTHFCQFYRTREDLKDILVPYFKAGLENNEFCMWVTSEPLEVEEAKEVLREAVSDFDYYLEKGQIEIIPHTHRYIKEGTFDSERVLNGWVEKLNQALDSDYEGLRLSGNTCWLEKKDWNNFVEHEEEIDGVIGNYNMMALCTYSLDRCSTGEIVDVVTNHQFALIKKEGKWEQVESPRRKKAEEALRQNEERIRLKKDSILSPSPEMVNLELAEIVDSRAVQSLMDDFYKLANIAIGIIDLKGNVLVGVGWQDICTKFHRVHPETCKHCVESNIKLSAGVSPGEFRLYRCRNNMWDIATPIMVNNQHVGYILLGQFFFEGEPLDYELFRSQASKYGFDEEEYMAALEKVPRLSGETVNAIMAFFMKLANMISQLSYSNIMLAQSLAERGALVDALQESEKRYRMLFDRSMDALILSDPRDGGRILSANPAACRMLGWAEEELIGRGRDVMFDRENPAVSDVLDELMRTGSTKAQLTYTRKDGTTFPGEISSAFFRDANGDPRVVIIIRDITERKKAEEALKKAHDNLEKLVEERTVQLEKAYNSLKESEKGLAEAQKMAHIGNWEWDIATDKAYWSEEMYRIFGREPRERAPSYNEYLSYIHPDDREYFKNAVKKAVKGKPYSIDNRIISANGEERTIHIQSEVIFDEDNLPIQIKGIVQDITERKKAEEALVNLETARKKEIHHRIKNNLQVISSLLDLQAEKFNNRESVENSEIMEAFRESQDRVMSIALIHEELHEDKRNDTLNFSPYLKRLVENLFQTYKLENADTSLDIDLEENIFFDMDTAVPLGIIINELVSNSLKHAFQGRDEGIIQIKLYREINPECTNNTECANNIEESKKEGSKDINFILTVSDNGVGIPESFNQENSDTLGIQLVSILVDQLDGKLELERDSGTEFIIRFTVTEKTETKKAEIEKAEIEKQ